MPAAKTAQKKDAEPAGALRPDADYKAMNLFEKFVELRRACPEIIKRKHSDGVKYTFAKIFDVYELLAPAMNVVGVDWEIVKEEAEVTYCPPLVFLAFGSSFISPNSRSPICLGELMLSLMADARNSSGTRL